MKKQISNFNSVRDELLLRTDETRTASLEPIPLLLEGVQKKDSEKQD